MTDDAQFIVELLKQKSQEGHEILAQYIRAFIVFVTITGGLIKFAFDVNSTPLLRKLLIIFGIALSVNGMIVCIFGEKLRRTIVLEIKNLNGKLSFPLVSTELLHIKYTVIAAFLFVCLVFSSWIYLLLSPT